MYPREFGCGVFLGCPRCVLTRWYHHAVQTCLCTQPVNLSWHHNEWLLLLTTQECGRVLLRYFSKTFFVKVLFQCCTRGTSTPKAFIVALFCRSFSLWSSSCSLWLLSFHTNTHAHITDYGCRHTQDLWARCISATPCAVHHLQAIKAAVTDWSSCASGLLTKQSPI